MKPKVTIPPVSEFPLCRQNDWIPLHYRPLWYEYWATWRTGVAVERGVHPCDDLGTENRFQTTASGVRGPKFVFFFWTEKGFQFWNGGIWCLRGWGNLRIFTRNGRRGADFHMLAGRIAAACAFWNIKRLLNLNSLIFWGGNFQLGCTWQHFGRDFKAKIELIRAPARWVWDFAPDNFRACVCCPL